MKKVQRNTSWWKIPSPDIYYFQKFSPRSRRVSVLSYNHKNEETFPQDFPVITGKYQRDVSSVQILTTFRESVFLFQTWKELIRLHKRIQFECSFEMTFCRFNLCRSGHNTISCR